MKKIILLLALSFVISVNAIAQKHYNTGIGLRLGGVTSGLTVKHFVTQSDAFEFIGSFGYRSTVITGLYERHVHPAYETNLNWFYGGGAHVGFFPYNGRYYAYRNRAGYVVVEGDRATVVGVDMILGLDYKFNNAPISLGLDAKPFLDFYDNGAAGYIDAALSLRFVF